MTDAMPPGWYEDPWHGPGLRYWDGHQWTTHTVVPQGQAAAVHRPVAPPRPAGPRRWPPWWVWTLAALGVIAPIGAFIAIIAVGVSNSNDSVSTGLQPFTPHADLVDDDVADTSRRTARPTAAERAGRAGRVTARRLASATRVARSSRRHDPVPQAATPRPPRGTRGGRTLRIAIRGGRPSSRRHRQRRHGSIAGGKTLRTDSALPGTCDIFPVEITLIPGQAKTGCVLFEVPTDARPAAAALRVGELLRASSWRRSRSAR